jgi:hypothetical protein
MDTFKDISAEEAKLLTIQFIGQQMGEIKDLNSRVINSSATLQHVNVDVGNIIKSIPTSAVSRPEVAQLPQTSGSYPAPVPLHTPVIPNDTNQLEFNFEASPYSKQIFDAIDRIERKLDTLTTALNKA